jgi:hypothetical protein
MRCKTVLWQPPPSLELPTLLSHDPCRLRNSPLAYANAGIC